MATTARIGIIINFVLMVFCVFISARQFAEKGFLFNNAYLFATKAERAKMEKKPYYRQSAIVFCLLGAVFFVSALSIVIQIKKLLLLEIPLFVGIIIYVITSSVKIGRQTKR